MTFYVLYYSFHGKTFFYYFCNNTDIFCDGLFVKAPGQTIDIFDGDFNYVYYKIYFTPTNKAVFSFFIFFRVVMIILNIIHLSNIIYLS